MCHAPSGMGGYAQYCWPGGGGPLDEPYCLTRIFALITREVADEMSRKSKSKGK